MKGDWVAITLTNTGDGSLEFPDSASAYLIQLFFGETSGYTNLDIQERDDRTVNVIATGTNQTVTTADAQYVIETYDDPNEFIFTGSRSSQLIVLSPDGNTGYVLIPSGEYPVGETRLPDQEQIMDSFELLSTATAGTAATTATSPPTTTPSAPQGEEQQAASSPLTQQPQLLVQQQQSQQQQSQGASVSIVPGSSTLTTDAYQPNPVQVSVGDKVTWTNNDTQPHTATSGHNVTPDGRFDSGIMAPGATFEHTFTEVGEYPYISLLHPNMVGTERRQQLKAAANPHPLKVIRLMLLLWEMMLEDH